MIERLARVLSPQAWQALNTPCDTKAKKKRREVSLEYARMCIEAMCEPTDHMINIGKNQFLIPIDMKFEQIFDANRYEILNVWKAMINAAMEEK